MGLAKPRVHLLPVHVLLEDDCFDTLGQDAVAKRQILNLRPLQVGTIELLLGGWRHAALVHNRFLLVLILLEHLLLRLPVVLHLPVV